MIDFGQLYRDHMARASKREIGPAEWDTRADIRGKRTFSGAYVEGFLGRLDLAGCETLLDVGCGPGTIALSVAPRLRHVYGVDFSERMLASFVDNANARGLDNVTAIRRAWEDPWDDVPVCDVAVASRSSQVADLEAALLKLDAHARRRVYLTHRVGGRFVGGAISNVIGRSDEPLPDYIYAVNILHQHGIHARVDFLEGANRLHNCLDFEECLRKVEWSMGTLTEDERERLLAYYDSRQGRVGEERTWWALISWEKGGP